LVLNTTGSNNVAIGQQVLQSNTTGTENTVIGYQAQVNGSTTTSNVALGYQALFANTVSNNTAIGHEAGRLNTTGTNNTLLGKATVTGNFSGSIILGVGATATADNQFVVGSAGTNAGTVTTEANTSTKVWNVKINGVDYKILLA
jgi:carbonic anhydrase/acetyltransferase-like protein (isoleucine patch superfamily)